MNTILDKLEEKWRNKIKLISPKPTRATDEVQFFAWDEDEDKSGDGIVVCIGSNYGQSPTKAHFPTKAELGTWFNNYRHAAIQVSSPQWEKQWREHGWLVGINPPLKPRYFIMTNIVPWITERKWTDLTNDEIADLLKNSTQEYLCDLAKELPNAFAVGHGISSKTFPFLQSPLACWANRMYYTNLSYQHTPTRWADGRFVF
jgi:hypothetical protein